MTIEATRADAGYQRRFVDDPPTPDTGTSSRFDAVVDIGAYVFQAGALGTVSCSANGNSTGAIGTTDAFGSAQAPANSVSLTAAGLPTNQFGFFIVSRTLASPRCRAEALATFAWATP